MRSVRYILMLSALSFLAAAGILGLCIGGPAGLLGAPFLAMFGWFSGCFYSRLYRSVADDKL